MSAKDIVGTPNTPDQDLAIQTDVSCVLTNDVRSVHVTAASVVVRMPPAPKVDQRHAVVTGADAAMVDGNGHPLQGGGVVDPHTSTTYTFSQNKEWVPECCAGAPTGPTGPQGVPGAPGTIGPTGSQGPAASPSGMLKFSGRASTGTSYLYDTGNDAGVTPMTANRPYPTVAPGRTFVNMAVLLDSALGIGETVTITMLKNGGATALTITFTNVGVGVQQVAASVPYATGDSFVLRATNNTVPVDVTVTVGLGP